MRSWWFWASKRLQVLVRLRTPRDIVLILRIFVFAVTVPLLMRLRLQHVQLLLEPRESRDSLDAAGIQRIFNYIDGVLWAGWPLVRSGCLTRGVTRYYFFRRAGLNLSLCFGVGYPKGKFIGHCWLVKDGEPFLEITDPRPLYAEIYRFSKHGLIGAMADPASI